MYLSSRLDPKQLASKTVFILFTVVALEFSTAPGGSEVFNGFLLKSPLSPDVTQLALRVENSLDLSVYSWRKEERSRMYLGCSSLQGATLSGLRVGMASYRFQIEAQQGRDKEACRAFVRLALTHVTRIARNRKWEKSFPPSEQCF